MSSDLFKVCTPNEYTTQLSSPKRVDKATCNMAMLESNIIILCRAMLVGHRWQTGCAYADWPAISG